MLRETYARDVRFTSLAPSIAPSRTSSTKRGKRKRDLEDQELAKETARLRRKLEMLEEKKRLEEAIRRAGS